MTQQQVVSSQAVEQATSQPEAGNTAGKKGDYTKYFYRNIDHLWSAVEQLQSDVNKLQDQNRRLQTVLNGGM